MKDQFGLIFLIIVLVILVGGFVLLSWGRRPRTPRGNEAKSNQENREHEEQREGDNGGGD